MPRQILFALVAVAVVAAVGCGVLNTPSEHDAPAWDKPQASDHTGRREPRSAEAAAQLGGTPLTVSVSVSGLFSNGYAWDLTVGPSGQADLTIHASTEVRKQFQIPVRQWAEFGKAVADARFFDLKGEYGEGVPCGSRRCITVTAGGRSHTVTLLNQPWDRMERSERREVSRALSLVVLARGLFDEPEAFDSRPFDKTVLNGEKD